MQRLHSARPPAMRHARFLSTSELPAVWQDGRNESFNLRTFRTFLETCADSVLSARKHGPKVAWLTLFSMECKNMQEVQNIGSQNCQAGRRSLESSGVLCRIMLYLGSFASVLKASQGQFGNFHFARSRMKLLELESAKSTVSPSGLPN